MGGVPMWSASLNSPSAVFASPSLAAAISTPTASPTCDSTSIPNILASPWDNEDSYTQHIFPASPIPSTSTLTVNANMSPTLGPSTLSVSAASASLPSPPSSSLSSASSSSSSSSSSSCFPNFNSTLETTKTTAALTSNHGSAVFFHTTKSLTDNFTPVASGLLPASNPVAPASTAETPEASGTHSGQPRSLLQSPATAIFNYPDWSCHSLSGAYDNRYPSDSVYPSGIATEIAAYAARSWRPGPFKGYPSDLKRVNSAEDTHQFAGQTESARGKLSRLGTEVEAADLFRCLGPTEHTTKNGSTVHERVHFGGELGRRICMVPSKQGYMKT
ncbi:unnamed protein product [Protopolystoma xenopodis]|uniref:Uncharacterized protein n=1 Tax=Protopolystoma xenopodis TaxID=117903 RepID=A0A3S5B3C0_9PLAT|nr:unnamed protein product [Protopolystoma xenopodis]